MAAKMIPYDNRVRIVDAYRRHGNTREVADIFGVSTREVCRLAAREDADGDLRPHPERRDRKPKLTQEQLDKVEAAIREKPDITIADLIHDLNLPISVSRLSRIVRKPGFDIRRR